MRSAAALSDSSAFQTPPLQDVSHPQPLRAKLGRPYLLYPFLTNKEKESRDEGKVAKEKTSRSLIPPEKERREKESTA